MKDSRLVKDARLKARRQFLRYLAASPLLSQAFAQSGATKSTGQKPSDVLSVTDFEEMAHAKLPPAHWGYLASGVDDNLTRDANHAAYEKIELRPHRLVDVSKIDTRVNLYGIEWPSPIFLCPVGGQGMFDPEGEVAVARAAKSRTAIQILSTQTSASLESVRAALGRPPWYQLYMPQKWEDTEKLIHRAAESGVRGLVWTVDLLAGRNTEFATRLARTDTRECLDCHVMNPSGGIQRPPGHNPMLDGLSSRAINPAAATWDYVDRLKKLTDMKLLLKGIETREDARMCRERGVDGIVVSNHGGRATEDLRPTIESLPEVIDGAGPQMTVLVDGGIRRGTDVFKALAMGAKAVGIGRPYIWGLTAFGQAGVERVLDILRAELQRTMGQCGTPTVAQITRTSVDQKRS